LPYLISFLLVSNNALIATLKMTTPTSVSEETTYPSRRRRVQDRNAGGRTGKDARIRKGKVGRGSIGTLRIRGGQRLGNRVPEAVDRLRPISISELHECKSGRPIGWVLRPEGLGNQNDVDEPQEEDGGENEMQCEPGLQNPQSGASVPVLEEPILSASVA
jgi:hypothetical protein